MRRGLASETNNISGWRSLNVETMTGRGREWAAVIWWRGGRWECCVCRRPGGRGTKRHNWLETASTVAQMRDGDQLTSVKLGIGETAVNTIINIRSRSGLWRERNLQETFGSITQGNTRRRQCDCDNGVARIFLFGGANFPWSPEADQIRWGGGGSSRNVPGSP